MTRQTENTPKLRELFDTLLDLRADLDKVLSEHLRKMCGEDDAVRRVGSRQRNEDNRRAQQAWTIWANLYSDTLATPMTRAEQETARTLLDYYSKQIAALTDDN